MPEPIPESALRALHAAYCQATGIVLSLTMQRLLTWERWLAHMAKALADTGSTATPEQALRAVVAHRRRQFAAKRGILSSVLAFGHLVGRPELAEEDFAAWRAARRAKAALPDRGLAAVLRGTGRDAAPASREAQPAAVAVDKTRIHEMIAAARAAVNSPQP